MPIVELLSIGREILDGRVIDTNAIYFAEELGKRGHVPRHAQRVDDDMDRIVAALSLAASRSSIVLLTGGLGPTSDDITTEAFSKFLGVELEENASVVEHIKEVFNTIGRTFSDVQRKQALFPKGSTIMPNEKGTAPGFICTRGPCTFYVMPGVPKEMKAMFQQSVLPHIESVKNYRTYTWATQFTGEGDLQDRLNPVIKKLPQEFEFTFRTRFPENHIGLHGVCGDASLSKFFDNTRAEVTKVLGVDVFSHGTNLQSLEEVLVSQLIQNKIRVATVESCTGGLVANRMTDISGSSETVYGSWITYDNKAKIALGVAPQTLENKGAVSPEIAESMARAGLELLRKNCGLLEKCLCISTTGIAGPLGGTSTKPVGLCYVSGAYWDKNLSAPNVEVIEVRARPGLERKEVKLFFSQKALELGRRMTF